MHSLSIGLFFTFLIFSTGAKAQQVLKIVDVNGQTEFDTILRKAKAEGKVLIIEVYIAQNATALLMNSNVLSSANVVDRLNERSVFARVDENSLLAQSLMNEYSIETHPSYLFFDTNHNYQGRISGYTEEKDFLTQLENFSSSNGDREIYLTTARSNGTISRIEAMELAVLLANKDPQAAALLGAQYIDSMSEDEILNPKNLEFMGLFTASLDGAVFKYLKINKLKFVNVHKQEGLSEVASSLYNFTLSDAINHQDIQELNTVLNEVVPLYTQSPNQLPGARFVTKKIYYSNLSDWPGYKTAVESYYNNYGKNETDFWYGQSYEVIENHNYSDAALELSFDWLEKALTEVEDFETYYLYGYGLAIAGKHRSALEKAEKAMSLIKNDTQKVALEQLVTMINTAKGGG